jgi:hypothetical protein
MKTKEESLGVRSQIITWNLLYTVQLFTHLSYPLVESIEWIWRDQPSDGKKMTSAAADLDDVNL